MGFLKLEDGGYLLLEDGGRLILQVQRVPPIGPALLMEDGAYLLLETGGHILLNDLPAPPTPARRGLGDGGAEAIRRRNLRIINQRRDDQVEKDDEEIIAILQIWLHLK